MATGRQTGAIGIMDGAFFVSKKELLAWLNELLGLNYTKIEDTANGAAACQVFDAIFPGKVPLHKVNFGAKLQHEMVKNYKVLQDVFARCGVQKVVDVDKLIMGKPMDNLEWLQWVKRYFDLNAPAGLVYDGAERRRTAGSHDSTVAGSVSATKHQPLAPIAAPHTTTQTTVVAETPAAAVAPARQQLAPMSKPKSTTPPIAVAAASVAPTVQLRQQGEVVEVPVAEFAQLKYTTDVLERERDFYFSKLHEIEGLCSTASRGSNPELDVVLTKICEILFRKPEATATATTTQH